MRGFYPRGGCYAQPMLRPLPRISTLALLLAGCASTHVTFPNATPGQALLVPADEYRPRGDGPFPAVVLLHGCGGVSPSTRQWGRWFRAHGYVALVVDS